MLTVGPLPAGRVVPVWKILMAGHCGRESKEGKNERFQQKFHTGILNLPVPLVLVACRIILSPYLS